MADLKISALTASTTPLAGTEVLPIVQSGTTKQVSVANLTAGRPVSMTKLTASIPSGATYHELVADGLLNYGANGYLIGSFNAATVAGTPGVYVGYNSSTKAGIVGPSAVGGAPNQGLEIWAYDNATAFKQVATVSAVTANAGVTLNLGNLIVQNGNGIDFSATSGSGTSELLADYEEGDWTPTVYGSSTAGTYTVGGAARYTKVGRLVTATARITFSAASGGNGNINIGNLPFNYASGNAGDLGMVAASNLDLVNASPASLSIIRNASGSDSIVNIVETVDNGAFSFVQINNVSTSTVINFTFIYNA